MPRAPKRRMRRRVREIPGADFTYRSVPPGPMTIRNDAARCARCGRFTLAPTDDGRCPGCDRLRVA